ncbi:MAG TPA: DUF424 family protein [Candidatus Diapherotrites archaeon]|jgi:hypothetical protein|nr:DUF424 family protein [Candidatus Diapherotrites archaeon]
MIGKVHNQNGKIIFACCDKELMDKTLKHGEIEIHLSKSFYGSEKITEKGFLEQINNCDCANVFGNRACDVLLKKKIITKGQIIHIDKIAHTQIYKI